MMPHFTSSAGPIAPVERIASIDVLRGFAVLGILVMNIQSFAMIDAAYINPTAYGDLTGINYAVWLVSHLLADQKFMAIFSMLFGAGIVLMAERRERSGLPAVGVHYRRMIVLLIVGLLHAYLLWFGDILYTYALCGMIVYPLRRLRPALQLALGLSVLCIPTLLALVAHLTLPFWGPNEHAAILEYWQPDEEKVAANLAAYRGSWLGQMPLRARTAFWFQTELFLAGFMWRTVGLMLIGMVLFRWDVFNATRSRVFYAVLIVIAVVVGLPVIWIGVRQQFAHGWDYRWSLFLGSLYNYWASLLVSFGWVSVIMLLCRTGVTAWLTRPLAATGRMAFTNYLLQTVIATTIFYGHGFGYFGFVDRRGQALIVLAVCVLQIAISTWWLRRFDMGPMERIWRWFTYGRHHPRMVPVASPSPQAEPS